LRRTIDWRSGRVVTVDQSLLPDRYRIVRLETLQQVLGAIGTMKIRGAPLIGAASAYALALEAYRTRRIARDRQLRRLREAGRKIRSCRPTGRDTHRAVQRVLSRAELAEGEVWREALSEAKAIADEYEEVERAIVEIGQALVRDEDTVLTHCNSGSLATVAWGTALGILIEAWRRGKRISVVATETRPMLQGARLSAWELKRAGVPFKLIADNMVGYVMTRGLVNKVLVGADRIWRDGSVANKIGTLTIATVAKEHSLPFYVAAPTSTFDPEGTPSYDVIEMRNPEELSEINGRRIAPRGIECLNPAFDITPPDRVSAIVTERGIIYPPFERGVSKILA